MTDRDDETPAAEPSAAVSAMDEASPGATPSGETPPGETPAQKALRLKQAKLDARPKPPRGGRFQREQAARIATGASRPWMSK